jgi:hypothetical protein
MNELLDLRPGHWNLILPTRLVRTRLLMACARLAERVRLHVLDCGRQFDVSVVARAAGGRREILERITVQRAFICSDTARLLQQTAADGAPILVLDLLSTFCDENVSLPQRRYLFEGCLLEIERLSRGAGAAVVVQPPPQGSDATPFLQSLMTRAVRVLTLEAPTAAARQERLFEWET